MRQVPQKRIAVRALAWVLAPPWFSFRCGVGWALPIATSLPLSQGRSPTATHALAPVMLPEQAALEDYRFALERPLFHPSRRPFPDRKTLVALEAATKAKQTVPTAAAPPTPPPPPSPPQGVQLRGTVLAGPLQSAVFERTSGQTYIRVREGEQLDGWTLVKIGREEIVLRRGDQSVTWLLARANDGKPNEGRQRRNKCFSGRDAKARSGSVSLLQRQASAG